MLEAMTFLAFSGIVATLVTSNLILRMKARRATAQKNQLDLDNKELERHSMMNSITDVDGFVKFLSESRESAFSYIEQVQAAILGLKIAMDSGIDQEIKDAYIALTDFLPDETNNN